MDPSDDTALPDNSDPACAPPEELPTVRAGRFKDQARSQFDQWAHTYDRSLLNYFLFTPAYLSMMREIATWRRDHPQPFDLLDIGCGTGSFARLILSSGWPATVTGMDFSPSMCAAANRKNRSWEARAAVVAGDSEHLPFTGASFDVVTCANSFHHYPHQQDVVGEVRRILRPGGMFVLVDGFRDNAIGWAVFDVVVAAIERDIHHAPWLDIQTMFDVAGFQHIRQRKSSVLFPICTTAGQV